MEEQNKVTTEVVSIDDLKQDQRNFNKGTSGGAELMERSFKELGAGRSILLDRDGNIIAGNKSQKAAMAAGIKKVRVIETTGDELVAVKRTDIDIDSAEGRKMALLDNLTTQVNLAWDPSEIEAVSSEIEGFDAEDYMPDWVLEQIQAEEETAEAADARDDTDDKKEQRKRDPDSEIIVATVSLFGTTEDMMLTQQLTIEEADKLIKLAKQEGAGNLMKRIIEAL